jgi:NTP pyrophosphatase (non-canonical NTP hydrolase)
MERAAQTPYDPVLITFEQSKSGAHYSVDSFCGFAPGKTMDELLQRLIQFRDRRNWKQFHSPKDLAMSVSIEAAELLEIFQWHPSEAPLSDEALAKAKGEAADVLLYLLLLCDALGIDPIAAADEKISLNERRFPVSEAYGVAKPRDASAAADDER